MTVLTAYVNVRPDSINDALEACRIVRAASVTEPGCERYDFFQSPDEPTRVVFVEEWTTRQDLELHFQQDAFKTFFGIMGNLTATPSEVRIFESLLTE